MHTYILTVEHRDQTSTTAMFVSKHMQVARRQAKQMANRIDPDWRSWSVEEVA